MKTTYAILALFLSTSSFSQSDTVAYESKVREVTIFFSGAQVSRSADVVLKKGKNVFKLDKLPMDINPQSIQVQGVEGGKILSVKHDFIYPDTAAKSKEELALRKKIDERNFVLTAIKSRLSVSGLEEKLLIDNSLFTSEKYSPSIQEVKEAADAYKRRLNELQSERLRLSESFDSINDVIKDIYFKINELRANRQKPYSTILVAMETEKEVKTDLRFSYYIKSARWEPLYDFRVDDVSKPLTIVYNAKVYQTSGEDWKAVNVRLSANNPTIGGTKPELEEWILGQERIPVYSYDNQKSKPTNDYLSGGASGTIRARIMDSETKEPVPFANVLIEQNGTQITGGTSDFDGICLIKPVPAGRFTLKASFVGYSTAQINGVLVITDQIRFIDVELNPSSQTLDEVVIMDFKAPLISKDNTQSGGTVTSEDIGKMQGRSRDAVAATVGGVYNEGGEVRSVRGAREEAAVYYVDGVKVRGSRSIPKSSIEQMEFLHSGLPAKYADDTYDDVKWQRSEPSKPKKAERKTISNAKARNTSVNLEYAIDEPYTIPTDGQDYTLKIKEVALPVDYVYQVVPKLDKDAFLMADIEDWSELNLLPGKTSIYYQGTFTSESEINTNLTEDTLKISLGRDKNVFVKREIRKELNDKKIFGNSVRETVGFDIVLRNNKNAKVKLIVEDQLPLSEKESISVEQIDLAGATFEKNTGKLTWTVELEPNEKKTITYKYAVKYARGLFIRLE